MREVLCRSLVDHSSRPDFVFLTGDLGFNALEPLRDRMGPRFLNAGVAEQNMICVAAGLAKMAMRPWVYSIAPFVYARPFEQIRNNVCLPDLPVVLLGNGGGYGYGVMGSTHHALEDYGALLTLANMRVFLPAFDPDVKAIIDSLMGSPHPAYLRLGLSELPRAFSAPEYAPWRHLISGGGPTLLVAGPIVGGILDAVAHLEERERPSVWVLSELPLPPLPPAFLADLRRSGHLFVVEEHVLQGGLGQAISHHLLSISEPVARFTHRFARGYVSGLYGSQKFHRKESQLDPESILAALPGNGAMQIRLDFLKLAVPHEVA
jgi:transketolase